VQEHANALVARSAEPETLGLRAEPPVHLRDRKPAVVEPVESEQQAGEIRGAKASTTRVCVRKAYARVPKIK